jgi:hypothetical protein
MPAAESDDVKRISFVMRMLAIVFGARYASTTAFDEETELFSFVHE